jgi:hypothetical protein
MCEDINFLAFVMGLILFIFIIYKYKYKKYNNKLLNELIGDLPVITKYYL